jgi:hypothetical protein
MRNREVKERAEAIVSFTISTSPSATPQKEVEDICKLVDRAVKDEASKWKKILLESSGQVIEESVNDAKSEKRRIIKKLIAILQSEGKKLV